MQIDITDQTDELTEAHFHLINQVLSFAAKQEKISPNVELSVSIVTNETIQLLNWNYRQKNEATDVLSFELDHPFDAEENIGMPLMMGDIIISSEKIKEQAKRYNHSFERELSFLVIHGFLHLMGYTHDNKEDEKVMFEKQDVILKEFDLER